MKKRIFQIASILISVNFTIVAFSQTAFLTLRDKDFNITIPYQWDTIPKQIIEQAATSQVGSSQKVEYDYGFFYTPNDNNFAYPYVLFQNFPIADMNHQSFLEVAKYFTKELVEESIDKILPNGNIDHLISSRDVISPFLDEKQNHLYTTVLIDVANIGKVKGLSVLIPYGKGIVAFHCYSLLRDFEKFYPSFKILFDKISFSDPYVYTKQSANASANTDFWGTVLGKVVMTFSLGGILFGLFALISLLHRYFFINKSKSWQNNIQASEQNTLEKGAIAPSNDFTIIKPLVNDPNISNNEIDEIKKVVQVYSRNSNQIRTPESKPIISQGEVVSNTGNIGELIPSGENDFLFHTNRNSQTEGTQRVRQDSILWTVGSKTYKIEIQDDGSRFIPFEDGSDDTDTIQDEVDTEKFEVVPVIEEEYIPNVPIFAKGSKKVTLKGVKIVQKSTPADHWNKRTGFPVSGAKG